MNQSVNSLHLTFDNKVAIVTGTANGIGNAICRELAMRGASVAAIDVLEQPSIDWEQDGRTFDAKVNTYQCDLTDSAQVKKVIGQIKDEFGQIDILINVAGGVAGQIHQPIENVNDQEWDKVVDINLKSTFYMVRAVVPYMKEKKYGRIVNISSGAGRSSSLTGIQAYTSAKAGQIGFTRQMARELGEFGITVNNIAPGFVLSNPSTEKQWDAMSKEEQQNLVESISVKRLGTPEDIAYPVLFFASDFARYVSGQVISADGGLQLF